jgi:glutamyl-tRNA reductase
MYMRIKPNETIEEWAKRVQQFEYGFALQQLAKGADVHVVMEAMSSRITEKLMHPIFTAVNDLAKEIDPYNADTAVAHYKKEYLDKVKPAPDHIEDSLK